MFNFKQIRYEIRNILKLRFLFIISILCLLSSILIPLIGVIWPSDVDESDIYHYDDRMYAGDYSVTNMLGAVMYSDRGYDHTGDPLIIDGITIEPDNPLYWDINHFVQDEKYGFDMYDHISNEEAKNLALEIREIEKDYYLEFAQHLEGYKDYRQDLFYDGLKNIYDKFIYEHHDVAKEVLSEALRDTYMEIPENFEEKYKEISLSEGAAEIERINSDLDRMFKVIKSNDYSEFVDFRIKQEEEKIEDYKKRIEIQEEVIVKNPSQEDSLSEYIEDMKKSISNTENNTIPTLKDRLEKNIIPGEGSWQDLAMVDKEYSQNFLQFTEIISEEEFNLEENKWEKEQYGSYQNYKKAMKKEIEDLERNILIAEKSLQTNKPDMKYVPNGTRQKIFNFIIYSNFVTLFGVLMGAWLMASEFQQGTIRLLMIRPKTRTKIYLGKYFAGLAVTLGVYFLGVLLNSIANMVFFGISDLTYPNYTSSGAISFPLYYLPKMLACIAPIIFAFSISFMLSLFVKNIAVPILIPITASIGSSILMDIFLHMGKMTWLGYTPVPYLNIAMYFSPLANMESFIDKGMPLNLTYGITLLLILSAISVLISLFTFEKIDITN